VRYIVAPALGADFVMQRIFRGSVARDVGWCVVEVGGERVRGEGVEGLWGARRIVEMDVEEEGVLVAGVSFLEFSCNGIVRGTDVGLYDLPDDGVYVCNFGKFPGAPVVQERCALEED